MRIGKDFPGHARVFRFFEEISKIPRRSFVTAPIAEYLCDFARARGLNFMRDARDNVVIEKAASPGAEDCPPLILQAHTDMVFVTADPRHEEKAQTGLTLVENGDFLAAEGTSLGGDDGIGVAYMLAILDDASLVHPPIEAVFTSNEEVGLLGATALDLGALRGRMLINLDSDAEGIFTAGCAGGSSAVLTLPFKRSVMRSCYTLKLQDLPGGHSGTNITGGIPNAILLSLKILLSLAKAHPVMLSDIHGGEASNAIPSFASIRFACDADMEAINQFCNELFTKDCSFGKCSLYAEDGEFPCSDEKQSLALIKGILSLPNGIMAMEEHLNDLPETSLSLGILRTESNALSLSYALRSSVDKKREDLERHLIRAAEVLGGKACIDGIYPAWEYKGISPLREACLVAYRALFDREPRVDVIHAGLECGIFASGIEGLDAISFGPTNLSIHTAEERLSLSSAVRTYDLLLKIISALAHID